MKKGQIYEGDVERVDFPNKGIVTCEDEAAIVKNTIPGQKISFMVNKKRKGKADQCGIELVTAVPTLHKPGHAQLQLTKLTLAHKTH